MAAALIPAELPYSICEEIWIEIFSYLKPSDILRVRLVCKYWALLSTDIRLQEKFFLQVSDEMNLQTFMTENETSHLPIRNINIVKLRNDKLHLKHFLNTVAPNIRCLKLTNSPIFETLADINFSNLKELHIDFKETPRILLGKNELEYLSRYNLTTLSIKIPYELKALSFKIEQRIYESNSMLKCMHVRCYWLKRNEFLSSLNKYANSLQELNIHFHEFDMFKDDKLFNEQWSDAFSKLKNLKILRFSGACHQHLLDSIFKSLPETETLSVLELDGVTTLTDDLIKFFTTKWKNSIKQLSIQHNRCITSDGVAKIRKLQNMRSFSIGHCKNVDFEAILFVVASKINYVLRELYVDSIQTPFPEDFDILRERLPNIEGCNLHNVYNRLKGVTNYYGPPVPATREVWMTFSED